MPESAQSHDTETFRNALIPSAPVILRCFTQGMTVEQCAAYLSFVPGALGKLRPERLESPDGYRTMREIFWMHQENNPEGLFKSLIGASGHQFPNWEAVAGFILTSRPYLFSWLPEAYRREVEEALRAPVGAEHRPQAPAPQPSPVKVRGRRRK